MSSTKTLIAVIVIVIIILGGAVVAISYLGPKSSTTTSSTTSTTNTSQTTTSSTSTTTSPSVTTLTSTSVRTSTFQVPSTLTTTLTNSTVSTNTSYALQLVSAGSSGPIISSPMNTSMAKTFIPHDGPCCTEPPVSTGTVNYTDHGNQWVLQGDIEPGTAWVSANTSGLTVTYQTNAGGPHHEYWGDREAFDDSSIYGDLTAGIPLANATIYSIDAYIPYYSYYSTCKQDLGNGSNGCSYEVTPYNSAALALDVGGNYVVVSFAEICNGTPCTSNGLQMSAFTSAGGASILKTLNVLTSPTYTPLHKLTIATDRKTFIDFYVDNTLVYSNTTLPIALNGSAYGQAEISQRTSINNETLPVTWSNFAVYPSSDITVNGLSSGMTLLVNGAGNFSSTATPDSNGVAVANVSGQVSNLSVSVELNGTTIATYAGNVSVGAELKFASNVVTTTLTNTYTTTTVTTYTTTNETTVVTTYTTTR